MKRKEFLGLSGLVMAGAALPGGLSFRDLKEAASGPAKLDARIFEVKMQYAWTLSRGTWNVRQNVLLRLEKDGVAGMGESAPIARYNESAESGMAFIEKARPILDRDLWQYVDRWNEIDALTPGEHAIKAALDIAILDWVARKLAIPLIKFLGLDKAKIPVTTYSIGIDEVKVMQQKIRDYPDFGHYKIKLGTPNDKAIIEGIREVTDKPLRPDANEGWKTKEEALAMIDWLADKGVELIEQPMPAGMTAEYKWLKERSKLPIFADESMMTAKDIPSLVDGFHGINIKLMKSGGVQEALRMIAIARALGLKIMIGCMTETSVAIAAAASISPLVDYADLDGNLLIANDPFKGFRRDKDRMILSDEPGLGLTGDVWK